MCGNVEIVLLIFSNFANQNKKDCNHRKSKVAICLT